MLSEGSSQTRHPYKLTQLQMLSLHHAGCWGNSKGLNESEICLHANPGLALNLVVATLCMLLLHMMRDLWHNSRPVLQDSHQAKNLIPTSSADVPLNSFALRCASKIFTASRISSRGNPSSSAQNSCQQTSYLYGCHATGTAFTFASYMCITSTCASAVFSLRYLIHSCDRVF